MSFHTLSAILRHQWLIQDDYITTHLSLAIKMANGEPVDFGQEKDEAPDPSLLTRFGPSCAVYGVWPGANLGALQRGSIVQVNIIGPVLKYGDMCSYGMSEYAELFAQLAANENVAAILLNIDSPGGQASGTQQLADAIRATTRTKPVVGMIDDGIAASAGMWIISSCSEIYVTKKTDQVGSIGVYTTLADWYEYAKSQGLPVRDIYAPQSSDKNGAYRKALEGDDTELKADLGKLASAFISSIKANRAGRLTSDEWNTGKMYEAQEAIRLGLIDGIKNYTQIVKRVEQLITARTNQNTSNMNAFAKTMAVANITQIDVVDGGFLVTEETLNAVEASLAGSESTIQELQNQVSEQATRITELEGQDHQATITQLQNQVSEQATRITELEAKPAGSFSKALHSGGDHVTGTAGGEKYRTSFDAEAENIRAIMKGDKN